MSTGQNNRSSYQVAVRLPHALHARTQAYAAEHSLSLTQAIIVLIRTGLGDAPTSTHLDAAQQAQIDQLVQRFDALDLTVANLVHTMVNTNDGDDPFVKNGALSVPDSACSTPDETVDFYKGGAEVHHMVHPEVHDGDHVNRNNHVHPEVHPEVYDNIDSEKHFLGGLCLRKHDFRGSGQSLRYKSTRGCCECTADKQRKRRAKIAAEATGGVE